MKIILTLILLLFTSVTYADNITTHYELVIPDVGDKDWNARISRDIISIDSIIYLISDETGIISKEVGITSTDVGLISDTVVIISNDIGAITDDTTGTVGGVVGRFKLVSDDGAECFILIYAPH